MPNEKNSATMLALPCRPTDVARTTTDGHQVPQQLPDTGFKSNLGFVFYCRIG